MRTKLLAKATSGKDKFIELEVDGAYLVTRWGYIDGKQQETRELCEGKNTGKVNETTSEEQAILEYERKIKKKKEGGYIEEYLFDSSASMNTPNFSKLQKEFCPCKPIAKPPKDTINGDYLADRKYNGVNIIITKDNNDSHIYTRRIDDISEQLLQLEEIDSIVQLIPENSMILIELTYFDNGNEFPEMLRGLINKRRSKEDVLKYYNTLDGRLMPVVFDVMFWNNLFVGNKTFLERREILKTRFLDYVPVSKPFNDKLIQEGRNNNWEGFVLRKPDGQIEYTMNGKAKRTGSWKWKYEETDDFIVLDAEYGKGKHDKYFARFRLGQYDNDGKIFDVGYCGPGRLTVTELKEMYNDRKRVDGNWKIMPFMVVEVLYRVRTKDGKLEFPVLQRIRDDKFAKECIYDS